MSLQSAWNQALYSATIGAGLYAHSEAGKAAGEIRQIKKQQPKTSAQLESIEKDITAEPNVAVDKPYTEAYKKQVAENKRLFELDPTEETFKEYKESQEVLEGWEEAVKYSQEKRQKEISNQKEAFEMRKKLLDPNKNMDFTYRKTKVNMEEENNGK